MIIDVLTFGETMVVMIPDHPGSLEQIVEFRKDLAGTESNLAIGLARLGHRVAWISRLGDDGFGRFIYKKLRGEGVDVSAVQFDPQRPTGIYFKEYDGTGKVRAYYYRAGSAASALSARDIPWNRWTDARYLFVTGVTPALGPTCRQAVYEAVEAAHHRRMAVVFDPNVRLKLWPPEEARQILTDLAGRCDIVLPGLDEGRLLTGQSTVEAVGEALLRGKTHTVVVKLGPQGAYYRTLDSQGYVAGLPARTVDEVGAGDAFAAGLLSGLLDEVPLHEAIRRGCALGALAVTAVGDYVSLPTRRELEEYLAGRNSPSR